MTFRSEMERAAWDKVAKLPAWHWSDLRDRAQLNDDTAQTFARRWERSGRVRVIRKDGHRKILGPADRAVATEQVAPRMRSEEGNMWRSMRRLTQFTPTDLAAHSNVPDLPVSREKAQHYCRRLCAAGYLRVRQTAIPGQREAIYQLIRDTGPAAPVIRRVTGIFDPNTGHFEPGGVPS